MVSSFMTDNSKLLSLFFKRQSIRKFKQKPVREGTVKKIVETGQRAPSACNLQTYSIIWARDSKIKEDIMDACEVTNFVRTAPIVFVVCADVRRLGKTLDYLEADHCLKDKSGYVIRLMSIMDAAFVAQNMTMAAECLGLGSVYIGTAAANDKVCRSLRLPEGVLPLTLLCMGYPDEDPPTRPRLPMSAVLHMNHYGDPSEKEIKAFLKHMDDKLEKEGYYRNYTKRGPRFHYSDHVQRKTATRVLKKVDDETLPVLRKAGFLPAERAH
jgi:nitroreductase